jgi:hypothetical protein
MKALKNWFKGFVTGIVREVVAESEKTEVDYDALANSLAEKGLNYYRIAEEVNLGDLAQEFDTDDIAREIARCQTVNEDDVIEKIAEDYTVDEDVLASKIAEDFDMDYDRLAKALLRTISKSALV